MMFGEYCITLSFPFAKMILPFWQKDSLLQYPMTLLQGPNDPVLPTLMYVLGDDALLYNVLLID